MMGQSAPSEGLEIINIGEEWLRDKWLVVLVFRGNWSGWRNGQRGTSTSRKRNAKFWTWRGITVQQDRLGISYLSGKEFCREGSKAPGEDEVDPEPAIGTCGKEGQKHHQMYEEKCWQHVKR